MGTKMTEPEKEALKVNLKVENLVKVMKETKKLYHDMIIKGYISKSSKKTRVTSFYKVHDLSNIDGSTRVETVNSFQVYNNQKFIVIELYNRSNRMISMSFATPDLKTFYVRKEKNFRQFTESNNSMVTTKLSFEL